MADLKTIILNNKLLTALSENWRSYHQEVADFCLPDKAWITTPRISGDRMKFNFLYDTVAIRSLDTMAAGFQSNLTNPSTKWFGLEPSNRELLKNKEVMMFFEECRDIQLATLARSNFNNTQKDFYKNYGCFGIACTLQLEDYKTRARFTSIPVEQINIEEDAYGNVIAVYRNFRLKAIQAFRLWGAAAGKDVAEAVAKEKYFLEFDFLHYCGPREKYDVTKKDAMNMPIESVWVEVKSLHLIHESGFQELPYHVARASKPSNDVFGYSQAMKALAAIKLINAQKKTTLRAAMKATDPPLQLPSRGYVLPLNLNPSALNYRLEGTNHDALQALPVGHGNFQIAIEMMQMERSDIEEFFFVPLFKALSMLDKQMTVPEVQRRIQENMVLLGPAVGDVTQEHLDPLIIRNFNIHWKNNLFPEAPQVLQNQEYQPVYLSPLAKAQRESELNTIDRFLGAVGQIANVKPQVLDKIDEDKTVDVIAKITGVTQEIMRDPREVDQIRQQRAQAQQAAAQMQAIQAGGAVAKDAATAAEKGAKAKAVAA